MPEATLEALAEGVVVCGTDGAGGLTPVLVNSAAKALLHGDLSAILGRQPPAGVRLLGVDGDPLGPGRLPLWVTAVTGEAVDGYVWGLEWPPGRVTWIRSASRPVPGGGVNTGGAAVAGVVFSLLDVTADHEAARALRAAHDRFTALVEHGSDVIIVLDRGGCVRYASPAYRSVYGEDPVSRVGRPLEECLHPEDRSRVASALSGLGRRPGSTVRIQCRVLPASGGERHVEVTASNRLADPAVGGLLVNTRDVTEWVETARRFAHHARHDSLTGLPNRAYLMDRLPGALGRARATRRAAALLLVDLDHFKSVNDSLGHHAGDAVLVALAQRVLRCVRPEDAVCRLGGDELVVVVEGVAGVREAVAVAERVRVAVTEPLAVDGVSLTPTCSIGIAIGGDVSPDVLLRQADTALYQAKQAGRDCSVVFGSAVCPALEPEPSDAGSGLLTVRP